MKVDGSSKVKDLKAEISKTKEKSLNSVDPDNLQLFVAKKGAAWLEWSDANDVVLNYQGYPQDFEAMNPFWCINDKKYFGDNCQPDPSQVHVLVMVPKSLATDPQILHLQNIFLRHALMDDLTSSSVPSDDFKASLITTYQCDLGTHQKKPMLRCVFYDSAFPAELVVACHFFFFRQKNAFLCHDLMSFDNIDDVRNGLLLFKPLKIAFDHLQISFIYHKDSDEFRIKVFDPSLRTQRLFAKLSRNEQNVLLQGQILKKKTNGSRYMCAPGTCFDVEITFGDLEGESLCFMSVNRPYKRCLNLQARVARKMAIEKKWILPHQDDFEDFWSEEMSLVEKLEFFSA